MRLEHGEHEQSDGARAQDGDGLAPHPGQPGAEGVARQPDGVHGGGEGLDEGGGLVVEVVGHGVQAVGGDGEPVGHPALGPAASEELQVLAEVLPAAAAHLAVPARQVRLDGDALSDGRTLRRWEPRPSTTPTTSWPGW